MKFSTVKKYRRRHKLLGALLIRNPVLVLGLDLPFVIAAATSLKNAAAMAIQIFIIHTGTMLVGRVTCTKLHRWQAIVANVAAATFMMMVAQVLVVALFRGISNSLGMYLYLMAVNAMTVFQSSALPKNAKIWPVFTGALSNALGFALVVGVVALIREYFAFGSLWGISLPVLIKLPALAIPFAGFMLMGFLLAFTRFLNKRLLALSLLETARKEARYTKIHVDSVETIDL